MWLMNYITKNSISDTRAEQGSVGTACDGKIQVNASSDFRNVPIVAPYGIAYVPPSGEKSIVLPTNNGNMCVGIVAPLNDLKPGEIMLYSAGGASLILKNDGAVYINGKEYT